MMILVYFVLCAINFVSCLDYDANGYIAYCPCMGRFGNQADHFLGVLAFSKGLNRTLLLPPWVEYRYGEAKSIQVPFDTYFKVKALEKYYKVLTMEKFMNNIAPKVWPTEKRISFCYTKRSGEVDDSCNAKSGNPFGPFWDTFKIDFVGSEFFGPLHYDAHNKDMMTNWMDKYKASKWPVLAFTGAPASFPVQNENRDLQRYMQWSSSIMEGAREFIRKNMSGGSFIGIHLRNGQDWIKACEHVKTSPTLFASPQCVGYKNERGPLTMSMCLPEKNEVIRQVKRAAKKVTNVKHVFVASDSNHMTGELSKALNNFEIKVVKLPTINPLLDLAILGQSNYFIGNCVSSFTAFVKRERDVRGLPSEFWSYPYRKKPKHEDL